MPFAMVLDPRVPSSSTLKTKLEALMIAQPVSINGDGGIL